METKVFETDIHCNNCVEKIRPILDKEESIASWAVDLEPAQATLSITGEHVKKRHINNLLGEAGYSVKGSGSFWTDLPKWNRASFNTLNCLIGCSIGDFGMIFYLQAYYPETSMALQMVLAIIAGLCTSIILETIILKYREHFNWKFALKTAFGMSFISMVAMELAMTSTDFMITGGKAAFSDPMYWLALVPALVVGFLVPLPYNYYKLKKFNQACH